MRLDGKVIIVTGAARGVGREHALLLATEGARVVVNDLGGGTDGSGQDATAADSVVAEIREAGGEAEADAEDVADWAGAERLVTHAIETWGRLDGLVNHAGILRDAMLVNLDDEAWDTSIRVNLKGHAAPTRAAARHWRRVAKAGERVSAAVVNTASESGVFSNVGQSNYAAAKAGVASLTEVWHKELGRYGVRVNAILPRARTRLTEDSFGSDAMAPRAHKFDKWHPANVSPWVAYLLSDRCPVSGHTFLVAGGLVQRARPWGLDPEWRLEKDGRWTTAELGRAVERMGVPNNDGRDTGLIR